ncbi:copper resistance protein CopC [Siccirubricoccus deserti]|uniref:Copper resistance protein CopC n=1 Tax=Siccirubricoccus deserti TaxID=2013562 RepID=A0A9X0QV61_9PROT|nr:copper resistance protein CopC [Siccirubricoccus deserti]
MHRLLRRSLLGATAILLAPRPAAAHAVVVTSEPAAGAALAALPPAVTVRFNSRIDHARSRLTLVAPAGTQSVLELAPDTEPTVLEAGVPSRLAPQPGAWRLRWQVLAIDGHITRGDVPFTIAAP